MPGAYATALDRALQTMRDTWCTLYAPILADVGVYGIPSENGWDLDLVTEEEAREWLAKQAPNP